MTARGSIQDFGPLIVADGFEDALTLWDALRAFYLQRRPIRAAFTSFYPETTVGDIHQVVGLLTAEAAKVPKDALGRAASVERWDAYRAEVQAQSAGLLMFDVFPDNRRFWLDESRALALDLATVATLPTKSDVVLDAVRGGFVGASAELGPMQATTTSSYLPDGVVDVLQGVAAAVEDGASRALDVARDVASEVKDAVKDVGGGAKDVLKSGVEGVTDAVVTPLVDAFGKPLLIGAAVVGGLLVVPRLVDRRKRRAA
jgi:hypothetical protein